jgi:hypothetical protein
VGCRDVWDLIILQKTMTDFPLILNGVAAIDAARNRLPWNLSADSIFDFFNTIHPRRTLGLARDGLALHW